MIIRALGNALRVDLLQKMPQELHQEEWEGIKDHFLLELWNIYETYNLRSLQKIIIDAQKSTIFEMAKINILKSLLGTNTIQEIFQLQQNIINDHNAQDFIKKLLIISPHNEILLYLEQSFSQAHH